MVITGNHITSFFGDGNYMGIANHTRIFLQGEGMTTIGYLVDFVEDNSWHQFIDKFKRPPHVEPVGGGDLIPQEPFHIAEKFVMRLKVTAVAILYY